MDVEILEEKENPLLERKEVLVKITHTGALTPKRSEIRDKLIAKLDADSNRLILSPLNQQYGGAQAIASVKVYKSKERALQVESHHSMRKNFIISEEKPAAKEGAPAKPAKEEAKTEEAPKAVAEKPKKEKPEKPAAEAPKEKKPEKTKKKEG